MRSFVLFLLVIAIGAGAYGYVQNPGRFAEWERNLQTKLLAMTGPAASPDDKATPVQARTVIPSKPEWTPPAVIPSEPNWTWTTPDRIYRNVVITKIEADQVTIVHADGRAVVGTWTLPADIRERLNYNVAAAAAAIALRENPSPAATPSSNVAATSSEPEQPELDVYQKSLALARSSGKPVLLHFDGSSFCYPCQMLDREVFATEYFQRYIRTHFVLLNLDYANNPPTTDPVKVQVEGKYHIEGFPTLVVIDANEKEVGRLLGYGPGFGENWVEVQLNAILNGTQESGFPQGCQRSVNFEDQMSLH